MHDLVRAVGHPYAGAFCNWEDRVVRVLCTKVPDQVIRGTPGRIVWLQGEGPFVVCADRALRLSEYRIEGAGECRLQHGVHLS